MQYLPHYDDRCFNSRTPGGVRRWPPSTGFSAHRRFNSRTPGGVRHERAREIIATLVVSIHAPREGCDGMGRDSSCFCERFNSRTPGGVRPQGRGKGYLYE